MCIPRDSTVETCFIGNWLIVAVRFAVEFKLCLEQISSSPAFVILCLLPSSTNSLIKINTVIHFINTTTSKSNTSIIGVLSWFGMFLCFSRFCSSSNHKIMNKNMVERTLPYNHFPLKNFYNAELRNYAKFYKVRRTLADFLSADKKS